jgi:hypothetical protein
MGGYGMKRVDEIEKEAHRVSRNGDEFSSFIQGAEWGDKTMIEKACKWLEQHKEDYNKYDAWRGEYVDFNALITDFKKKMEE